MRFREIANRLDGIPYTSPAKGKYFYDLVMRNKPRAILELGFAHGTSACYFAAAAQELGDCSVTAVDIEASKGVEPTIEALISQLNFQDIVSVFREESSYTWFLKKEIVDQTEGTNCVPKYDLVFIDGPKDWTNDGCAFFLADKLLRPNGIILFDDYTWSYRNDEVARGKQHDRGYVFENMSEAEFETPQIRAVFQLLVSQHPDYCEFEVINDQLAMAKKGATGPARTLTYTDRYSLRYRLISKARSVVRKLR